MIDMAYMHLTPVWLLAIPLLISSAVSVLLQLPEESNDTIWSNASEPLAAQDSLFLWNGTLLFSDSSSNEGNTRCDGEKYGRNLNIDSCLQALTRMGSSNRQATYRDRFDRESCDNRLPMITISSTL